MIETSDMVVNINEIQTIVNNIQTKGVLVNDLMTLDQAAAYLQMSKGALAQLRYLGKGPKYFALTAKTIRYRQDDIDAWVSTLARTSTAA